MRFMHFARPLARLFGAAPPSLPPARDAPGGAAVQSRLAPPNPTAAAVSAAEESRRIAEIANLQDGETLRQLAGFRATGASLPAPSQVPIERAAQQRLAVLIDVGAIDLVELCATKGSTQAALSVASYVSNPAYQSQVLAALDDPSQAARLVIDGPSSRVRQLAAQTIEDPAQLKQLLKQLRGKDKSVFKIIKQKCDALRAEEQRAAQRDADVAALCASLERHSQRTYDAAYLVSLEHFEARWRALEADAAPELRRRASQAIDRGRQVVADHVREAERQRAAEAQEAERQAAAHAAREEASGRDVARAQRDDAAAALAAAQAASIRGAEEQARTDQRAAQALALRQVAGLVAKAHGALRDGNTGRAAGLRRTIEEKLPSLPVVPTYLANQVHKLDANLHELKEWKDYAVAPKRAELIEEMEALIGSSEEPKVLADRIRQLQEDWKTISKGIVSDSEADWQRFHQAAVSAYQPCAEYFEAQAKTRQANLENRKRVLERLLAFEEAQNVERPHFPTVALVLREARQEWRRYFPVERAAGAAVQEEFTASMGRLQTRLDAWYANNVADKMALIDRARTLCAQENRREAADAVKTLQSQWKEIGAVPRDREQPLWNEFRAQCDAVFQNRQQAYTEQTAALEAAKTRAAALCEEAEQVAALSGPALIEGAARIPYWQADFESLGELPRNEERALQNRFARAVERCRTAVVRQRARANQRSFIDLLEATHGIQAYGWAVFQAAAPAEREALKAAAKTFIAGIAHWSKEAAHALKNAWDNAEAAAGLDPAANETALRKLCIRAEIATDLPTPPEDQPLRREYQVQCLMQRMGQQGFTNDDLDALTLEWVRVGPVPPATYDALEQRLLRSREAAFPPG